MKKFLLVVLCTIFSLTSAVAAPKTVALKNLPIFAPAPQAELLAVTSKAIVTVAHTTSAHITAVVTAVDASGTQMWQRSIDSSPDQIATAITKDSLGNIWLAGSSSTLQAETATAPNSAENPDQVLLENLPSVRSDMNSLSIWKIASSGELLSTFKLPLQFPPLVTSLSANSSGISISAQIDGKSIVVSATSDGKFGKPISLGSEKTSINAVVRNSDGSVSAFGSSSETLSGKKLVGKRDGILVKFSKSGAISTLVRSSAPKAERSWLSADASLVLTGYVKSGKVVESAVTKFTSAFAPTWTTRISSNGSSLVASSGSTTFVALGSQAPITGVSGWKPTQPGVALLAFDGKGTLISAYGTSLLSAPLALGYSPEMGLYGLAKGLDESVSIFRLNTR